MTFSMMYAYTENFVLPLSHDEVVHGKGSLLRKMPGDRWQQLANLRALYGYMWAHPGKQLLFMGCEFGQESEWSEAKSIDWWLLDTPDHRGMFNLVRDLNASTATTLRYGPRTTTRPASSGSTPTTPATTRSPSFARVLTDRRSPASPTSPAPRTRTTGSGCRSAASGARCSTPTPATTPAAASATSAECMPVDEPWHGQAHSTTLGAATAGHGVAQARRLTDQQHDRPRPPTQGCRNCCHGADTARNDQFAESGAGVKTSQ